MKGLFKQKNHLIKPIKKSLSQEYKCPFPLICHYQKPWEKMYANEQK